MHSKVKTMSVPQSRIFDLLKVPHLLFCIPVAVSFLSTNGQARSNAVSSPRPSTPSAYGPAIEFFANAYVDLPSLRIILGALLRSRISRSCTKASTRRWRLGTMMRRTDSNISYWRNRGARGRRRRRELLRVSLCSIRCWRERESKAC